jgi:feruloyl esterase
MALILYLTVLAAAAPPVACMDLAQLHLPQTMITLAESVPAGPFAPPGSTAPIPDLPAFCRVAAVVAPAINFEVWLPASGWNGKFQGVGNAGLAGTINYPAMATALRRGYATSSTDTGHTGTTVTADWALGHPELVVDYGFPSASCAPSTANTHSMRTSTAAQRAADRPSWRCSAFRMTTTA